MQHVGEPGTPEMKTDDEPSGGLSPVKAFFVLLALLVAIGGLFLLTRPTSESNPGAAPRSDNFALTDAEAIERFKELGALAVRATRDRDSTLVPEIFTADGPMRDRALRVIESFREDGVFERSRIEVLTVSILDNSHERIRLQVKDRLYPCFVSETGEDVSKSHRPIERIGIWTMKKERSVWKLDDSSLQRDRFLNVSRAIDCP